MSRTETRVAEWMAASISVVSQAFPELDVTYSFATELTTWRNQDVSALDVLEPHIWMANNELLVTSEDPCAPGRPSLATPFGRTASSSHGRTWSGRPDSLSVGW
jgi:hypothetical protein